MRSSEGGDTFDDGTVDVVALSPDGSVLQLVIVQAGPWTDSDAQLESLQAKIRTYVGYTLDGQLARDYPEAARLPWEIVLDCQTGPPHERGQLMLDELAQGLASYNGHLQIKT